MPLDSPLPPEETVARLRDALGDWLVPRARLAVLFGSLARGAGHPESDVDLAVWPAGRWPEGWPSADERLDWAGEVGRRVWAALEREPNLVLVSPRTDPVLGNEISRDGRVIHQAEPGSWPDERARLWHLYNDSLPFLRAERERLRTFAEARRGA